MYLWNLYNQIIKLKLLQTELINKTINIDRQD